MPSILTPLSSSSPMPLMIRSMSVPICNHFHAKRANSGKTTSFWRGCPSFAPSFVGPPSRNTGDSRLSYGENLKSLSHLGSDRYRDVTPGRTDRRTDRITKANTRYSQLALARKNTLTTDRSKWRLGLKRN